MRRYKVLWTTVLVASVLLLFGIGIWDFSSMRANNNFTDGKGYYGRFGMMNGNYFNGAGCHSNRIDLNK